jgi:hypothetical protein
LDLWKNSLENSHKVVNSKFNSLAPHCNDPSAHQSGNNLGCRCKRSPALRSFQYLNGVANQAKYDQPLKQASYRWARFPESKHESWINIWLGSIYVNIFLPFRTSLRNIED